MYDLDRAGRPGAARPAQGLGQGDLAPLRHHTADVKAPVGIEIIHHPIVTVHVWQLLDHIGQMAGEIGTGAGLAQMPHDLPVATTNEAIKARVP